MTDEQVGDTPGEPFEYDDATGAILVPEGAWLVWADFPGVGHRRVRNGFRGASAGDWLVWCVYDPDYDDALMVKAELRDRVARFGEPPR